MSAKNLASQLGVDQSTVDGLLDELQEDKEMKDSICEGIGAINPDGFGAALFTNDFRTMSRGKGAGKAGAVLSTGLKVAGVALCVMGARAGYRRLRS